MSTTKAKRGPKKVNIPDPQTEEERDTVAPIEPSPKATATLPKRTSTKRLLASNAPSDAIKLSNAPLPAPILAFHRAMTGHLGSGTHQNLPSTLSRPENVLFTTDSTPMIPSMIGLARATFTLTTNHPTTQNPWISPTVFPPKSYAPSLQNNPFNQLDQAAAALPSLPDVVAATAAKAMMMTPASPL
jgi:hypothetical protein